MKNEPGEHAVIRGGVSDPPPAARPDIFYATHRPAFFYAGILRPLNRVGDKVTCARRGGAITRPVSCVVNRDARPPRPFDIQLRPYFYGSLVLSGDFCALGVNKNASAARSARQCARRLSACRRRPQAASPLTRDRRPARAGDRPRITNATRH
ncbi:unnamed protein product, partial [Iphiclides podalirius]